MKNNKSILYVIIGFIIFYISFSLNETFGTIIFCILVAYIYHILKKRKGNIKGAIYKHNIKDRKNIYDYVSKPVKDYVVIDTETTGLSAQRDFIIEIAALRIKNGYIVDKFQTLVNPNIMIPKASIKIHGITDDMVATAPQIDEVLPQFLKFIGNDILIGHNITFDLRFINSYLDHNIDNKIIDTMRISRDKLPNLPNHKLLTLIQHFKLSQSQEHRSLSDCIFTYQVYEMLKEI